VEYRSRLKQAWTIAKIELRRAFFSKRAFWVYGLALLPTIIFFFHGVQMKIRRQSLSSGGFVQPVLLESAREAETAEAVIQRLGKPHWDFEYPRHRMVSPQGKASGITIHNIAPALEARYIRLNIRVPSYNGDPNARIQEMEVYGGNDSVNLALNRPATGSAPCSAAEGPEKAFNGNASDRWCSHAADKYLQVDLGDIHEIKRVVIKHASAGGGDEQLNTAFFDIQASIDNKRFVRMVNGTGSRFIDEITAVRTMHYSDGRREAVFGFEDGKLVSKKINMLMNFEEDRQIFAGIFQYFYLRLAIFFGCLGIFMNLFRGEMLDRTLHFWFLAPARREVLLAGKYGAGLIASIVIFGGGALLCFGVLLLMQNPAEVQTYWQAAGWAHAFWYTTAAALGCVGYGSVFLAAGLLLRNPILPAAVLLGWEAINGFLPVMLQKLSVLYYLQSLCPVPAPVDKNMPALLQLLLNPAAPASHAGAICGIIGVTALVLWVAVLAIRRMEVSYSTEA
jgi:ABC-type transport system involved in multi-copper enzyme maturation permease subunit